MTDLAPAPRTPSRDDPDATARPEATGPTTSGTGHIGAVDGLRAVAVLLVVAYHLDLAGFGGGFLGVDVFFVISGFLITSLLAGELTTTGRVSLRHFWWRRARRLLPALLLVLAGAAVAMRLLAPGEFGRLRGEFVAALLYVSNWYLIHQGASYFDSFARPSPLRHLWSLAIEEQYYLLWPIVFLWSVRRFGRRGVMVGLGVAAVASTAWMAALFEPGADPSRAYYGLDTRLAGLAVGASTALWWSARAPLFRPGMESETSVLRGRVATAGGVGAVILAGIVAFARDTSAWMYRGGFLLTAIATAAVVLAAVAGGPWTAPLGHPSAQWVGRRSYALYLVHWPVIALTRPDQDVDWHGLGLVVTRLVLTFVGAEVVHRWVETPLRSRVAARPPTPTAGDADADVMSRSAPDASRGPSGLRRPVPPRIALVGLGASTVAVLVTLVVPPARSTDVRDVLAELPDQVQLDAPAADAPLPTFDDTATSVAPTPQPTVAPPLPAPEPVRVTGPPVLLVGDSVMLRTAQSLIGFLAPFSKIDAKVSRQFGQGDDIIRFYRGTQYPAAAVVVHLGTNGPPTAPMVDAIIDAAGPVPVLLVNVRVARPYEGQVNQVLADAAARHPNVRIVNWWALAGGHPEWFESDQVHPNNAGVKAYVGLITASLVGVQMDPVLGPTMTVPPTTVPPPTTTTTTTIAPTTVAPAPPTTVATPPTTAAVDAPTTAPPG